MRLNNVKTCCCGLQYLTVPDDDLFKSKPVAVIEIYLVLNGVLRDGKGRYN
jgi:hypothetical protein